MAGRMRAAQLEPGMVVSSLGRAAQQFSDERVAAVERIPGFTAKRRLRFASGRSPTWRNGLQASGSESGYPSPLLQVSAWPTEASRCELVSRWSWRAYHLREALPRVPDC
jgi:hypothetical protein